MTAYEFLHNKHKEAFKVAFAEIKEEQTIPDGAQYLTNNTVVTGWLEEFARIKCLETAKNVRHKACDVLLEECPRNGADNIIVDTAMRYIQNIRNEDVIPEL
jgi:hypothetical protein